MAKVVKDNSYIKIVRLNMLPVDLHGRFKDVNTWVSKKRISLNWKTVEMHCCLNVIDVVPLGTRHLCVNTRLGISKECGSTTENKNWKNWGEEHHEQLYNVNTRFYSTQPYRIKVHLNGQLHEFDVDSQAALTVVNHSVFKNIWSNVRPELTPCNVSPAEWGRKSAACVWTKLQCINTCERRDCKGLMNGGIQYCKTCNVRVHHKCQTEEEQARTEGEQFTCRDCAASKEATSAMFPMQNTDVVPTRT
ncbi:hypothetical protein PR048_001989 [Dryococelus australis]|uniref:Phorbol-ester/DAG-type domain-containing protein n=1 Tax=Dryococelus australis TaxID=614101 RepID=A0ABQ9IIW1_9NEOP|nr:hypothetical protein PR048_001989 [Dryococelus australis]